MTDDDPRHGTVNGYANQRCRCKPCTDAYAIYHRAYMDRHPEQRTKARERMRRLRARRRSAAGEG